MGVRRGLLVAAALAVAWQAGSAGVSARQAGDASAALEQAFRTPPDDSRIMMRWWWFGPSVTREQIENEMRRMKEGGIGGFEIATVYPMAVDDPAHGIRNYRYLSPEYLDLIGFTARKARELGMRMDVTLGSGWSFGGPHITSELASARLRSTTTAQIDEMRTRRCPSAPRSSSAPRHDDAHLVFVTTLVVCPSTS